MRACRSGASWKWPRTTAAPEGARYHVLAGLLCFFLILGGCSPDREKEGEGSAIDQATKAVADRVVEQIKTPIDKAEAVKDLEEERRGELQRQAP